MRSSSAAAAALTGPFVASAAANGLRPPLRIVGRDVRAWAVAEAGADVLVVDEYGELLWCRPLSRWDARAVRPCWPEEFERHRDVLEMRLRALLDPAPHVDVSGAASG